MVTTITEIVSHYPAPTWAKFRYEDRSDKLFVPIYKCDPENWHCLVIQANIHGITTVPCTLPDTNPLGNWVWHV